MLVIKREYQMRALVYFLVWTCVTMSLLFTFVYLLTLVDPGLKELPEKAARMMRNEPVYQDIAILPSEQYMDFDELVKNKKNE